MSNPIVKWLLPIVASVALVGVLGTIYVNAIAPNNQIATHSPQTAASHENSAILASVWDRETEPSYSGKRNMTVYRDPACGCCGEWIDHAKKHGFQINDIKTEEMEALKQKYNLPPELASCHTAIIDGYVMEGHIPADDIKRFLASKSNFAGLAVPAMPLGTPGMEVGNRKQPFEVLAFNTDGKVEVFKDYQSY